MFMGRYSTTTKWLLEALIPELGSKKHSQKKLLFEDISLNRNINVDAIRNCFYRAIKRGLVEIDENNIPRLTDKGKSAIQPFVAKRLNGSHLLVIFDVPESERQKRDHLRSLLEELEFKQIQKSVWACSKDYRKYLKSEIEALNLQDSVVIYEARQIKQI